GGAFKFQRRTSVSLVAVFLFFGLGAALVGLALALVLASSPKRAAILSLGGVFKIVALVLVAVVSADADPSAGRECNTYLGHYLSPLVFFFAALNVAGCPRRDPAGLQSRPDEDR